MFFGEPLGTGVFPLGLFPPLTAQQVGRLDGMPDPFWGVQNVPWWIFTQPERREERLRELRREIGLLPSFEAEEVDEETTEAVETAVRLIVREPTRANTEAATFALVAAQRRRYAAAIKQARAIAQQTIVDSFKAEVISRLRDLDSRQAVAAKLEAERLQAEHRARVEDDDTEIFSILAQSL